MKFLFFILFFHISFVQAQKNLIFKDEVTAISKKYDTIWDTNRETVVFTGSSSVRMWKNIQELFPNEQIVNTGFGGSQTIDLLGYTDELILKYNPKKVFIYEGDNDLFSKKKPRIIIKTYEEIIKKIKDQNENTKVIIISPKPSIARLKLKGKYKILNRKLNSLCKNDAQLEFANVWDIMFDKRKLKTELFINDGLHMNSEGYKLWHTVIKNYMN